MKYLLSFLVVLILTGTVYASGQIDISYAGYTISQPGSYIVVADLHAVADQNAITIETSDVTIDLNGHTLYGAGTAVGSTGSSIYAEFGCDNIAVYNGTIRDFREYGIYLEGTNIQVSRIRAFANRTYGIYIGFNGMVWGNTARYNLGTGIYGGFGSTIWNNSSKDNRWQGIESGSGCTLTGNSAETNGICGIYAAMGCTVTGNNAFANDGAGILAGAGSTVIGNSAFSNDSHGIYAESGCTVKDNTVTYNVGNGIYVLSDCQVIGNTCNNNGYGSAIASGIRVTSIDNTIENNTLTDNDMGLCITSTGNFYASNRASGNTISNYSTVGAQTDGGATNSALTNFSFYYQPNLMIQHFTGFDTALLSESPDVVIRNLKW